MHHLIREIQAIAQTGLHYAKDPFDLERYQRLRAISFELMSEFSNADLARIERFFIPERGYATPKIDLRACIVRDRKVLLVRERADDKWTLPGGWADQNESPREGITREVKEESGYDVDIEGIYAIKDRDKHAYTPMHPNSIYKLFFFGSVIGGAPQDNIEISEIGFFAADELPELSNSRVLVEDIVLGIQAYESRHKAVLFD